MTEQNERLFTGGAVFDGVEPPKSEHAVLIRDGRIARFAPVSEFEGFGGPVEDLSGKTLLPGIIDSHVHLASSAEASRNSRNRDHGELALAMLANAQADLRGGVTSVRDTGGKAYYELDIRNAIAAGQHFGPTIACAGRAICMTGGHASWVGIEADGPDAVRKAVRENLKHGVDLIKIVVTGGISTPNANPDLTQFTEEEIVAGIGEALRQGKRCAAHAQGAEGIGIAVRAGITSIEHGFDLDDEIIAEMVRRGTYLVPTLSIPDTYARAFSELPGFMADKIVKRRELHLGSVKRFYKAGGKIAMGTDTGFVLIYHGNNCRELRLMHDIGMDALSILRAATTSAADLCGFEQRGRVADGYRADLLIVNGDPFSDIDCVAERKNHHAVYKDGIHVHGVLGREPAGPNPLPYLAGRR